MLYLEFHKFIDYRKTENYFLYNHLFTFSYFKLMFVSQQKNVYDYKYFKNCLNKNNYSHLKTTKMSFLYGIYLALYIMHSILL